MDLVSSTLDKYLKNRFSGNVLDRGPNRGIDNDPGTGDDTSVIVPTSPPPPPPPTTTTTTTNDPSPRTHQQPTLAPPDASEINNTNEVLTSGAHSTIQANSTNNLMTTNDTTSENSISIISNVSSHLKEQLTQMQVPQHGQGTSPIADHVMSNGTTDKDDCKMPTIYQVSISNTQPLCSALRDDMKYFAAGFENSPIHLWSFREDPTDRVTGIDNSSRLLAHSGSVYSIQFVKDTDLMLSCSEDTTIRLWCLNTKCNIIVYRGHNYPIWSLDIGSHGKFFASASMDATARLWRLDRITPLRIFCGHDDDVDCIKFHPNEKYIATGSSDTTVRLWSVSDGKMVRLMVGHQNPIISLSFLPDGKFLASASCDGTLKLWDLATNSVTSELSVPASFTISFSPEQRFVSSCGTDNVLSLWQINKQSKTIEKKLDFKAQASNLIQSHFRGENKLFVIVYSEGEQVRK